MRARAVISGGCVAAALALAGCGGADGAAVSSGSTASASASAPAAVKVEIVDFKFAPNTIVVRAGGRVTWTNNDTAPHTATADDKKAFDTATLRRGESKSITFSKPGTYSYVCLFHAFMVGKVVVK